MLGHVLPCGSEGRYGWWRSHSTPHSPVFFFHLFLACQQETPELPGCFPLANQQLDKSLTQGVDRLAGFVVELTVRARASSSFETAPHDHRSQFPCPDSRWKPVIELALAADLDNRKVVHKDEATHSSRVAQHEHQRGSKRCRALSEHSHNSTLVMSQLGSHLKSLLSRASPETKTTKSPDTQVVTQRELPGGYSLLRQQKAAQPRSQYKDSQFPRMKTKESEGMLHSPSVQEEVRKTGFNQ